MYVENVLHMLSYVDEVFEDISDELVEAHKLNLKLKRVLGLTSKLKSST